MVLYSDPKLLHPPVYIHTAWMALHDTMARFNDLTLPKSLVQYLLELTLLLTGLSITPYVLPS